MIEHIEFKSTPVKVANIYRVKIGCRLNVTDCQLIQLFSEGET